MEDGIIDSVAIQRGCVWSQDLPMKLGAQKYALELFRMVVPRNSYFSRIFFVFFGIFFTFRH